MKLFDRIAKYPRKLTNNETSLVDYIMSCYPQGTLETATSVAKTVGISPSTVVRFFSKLGYGSFAELQQESRLEISSKLSSPSQRARLTVQHEHSINSALDNAFTFDRENLSATRDAIGAGEFQAVIDTLTKPTRGRVYIVGIKNSYAVAHYLHTHLNMCLPNVSLLGTGEALLADSLLWASGNDILLAIAMRRYSRAVTQTARHFKQLGARVICITDSPVAPIAGLADHRILVQTASASPFDSYTAAFGVSNALVSAVTLSRKKETEALLERGEKLWDHFEVFSKQKGS